jgi:hypothetical protein
VARKTLKAYVTANIETMLAPEDRTTIGVETVDKDSIAAIQCSMGKE